MSAAYYLCRIAQPYLEPLLLLFKNAWFINQACSNPDSIYILRDIISKHKDYQLVLLIIEKLLAQEVFFKELLTYRGLSVLENIAKDLELCSNFDFHTIYDTHNYSEEAIKNLLDEFTHLLKEKIAKEEIEEATPVVNSLSQRCSA